MSKKILHYVRKGKKLYPSTFLRLGIKKVERVLQYHIRKIQVIFCLRGMLCMSNKKYLRLLQVNGSEKEIGRQIVGRMNPKFFWDQEDIRQILHILKEHYPESVKQTINEAEKVCEHKFNLLGSMETFIGKEINWYQDFKSEISWPVKFYLDIIKINYNECSDIKVPWELSRFHHLVTLGIAYNYTNDEKYAKEFVLQTSSWIVANPPMIGVNWVNTMEVAIRSVNFIFGYYFFRNSETLSSQFIIKFTKSLYEHGKFIFKNLEVRDVLVKGRIVHLNGNHYMANIVGLLYIGLLFYNIKKARRWLRFSLSALFHEIINQNNEEGVNYEFSLSYHRLVTELCLSAVILCQRNGIEIPQKVLKRLENMIDFIASYTKPDGESPLLGDADDGRLHIFSKNNINDHRYLLTIGAILFKRKDLKEWSGGFMQDALWLQGPKGYMVYNRLTRISAERKSSCFKMSGFYVMKKDDSFMIISCHDTGIRGTGGSHTHNDCLSFELVAFGKTFITDIGTYTYTGSEMWRNRFRRTAAHNTIMIDDKEINRIPKENVFKLKNDARPILIKWISNDDLDVFEGEHFGYRRMKSPVNHRRCIIFDKKRKLWIIRDALLGNGIHKIDAYFHMTKFCSATTREKKSVFVNHNGDGLIISLRSHHLKMTIEDDYVSPRYGVIEEAKTLHYSGTMVLPCILRFVIIPVTKNKSAFFKRINLNHKDDALDFEMCWKRER